jgi:hypothetical protein
MSKVDIDVDSLVSKYGQHITGQINISFYTEQTLEQFKEIVEQGSLEGDKFYEEDFIEYVIDNVAEWIKNEVRHNGDKSLRREISIVEDK